MFECLVLFFLSHAFYNIHCELRFRFAYKAYAIMVNDFGRLCHFRSLYSSILFYILFWPVRNLHIIFNRLYTSVPCYFEMEEDEIYYTLFQSIYYAIVVNPLVAK